MDSDWDLSDCTLDQFAVPQTINRNVLQALEILQSERQGFYGADDVSTQVKRQMECGNARVLHEFVRESLANLTDMGILACTGATQYCLRHTLSRNEDFITERRQIMESDEEDT